MKKFRQFFVNSFFCYLAIELVEEILEDLIALGISSLLVKGISTFLVVISTQGLKVVIKRIIKKITYKEGNDKVNKIKSFFKWIWANKKTLIGTIGSAVSGVATAIATNSDTILALPELLVFNFNITPILAGILVFAGVEIGVVGKGFEWYDQWKARKESDKLAKEQKAIEKEAKKELATEQKLANQTQAQQEKQRLKAEEELKAQEEKAKADAEHRAKVEEAKAKLIAEAKSTEKTGA